MRRVGAGAIIWNGSGDVLLVQHTYGEKNWEVPGGGSQLALKRPSIGEAVTRRHKALVPLAHDHHHALHNARSLRLAADGDASERADAASAFLQFFKTQSVRHFREEEEWSFRWSR